MKVSTIGNVIKATAKSADKLVLYKVDHVLQHPATDAVAKSCVDAMWCGFSGLPSGDYFRAKQTVTQAAPTVVAKAKAFFK